MNQYESIIIVRPNANEEEIEKIITKVENIINTQGKVTKIEKLGLKELAYEIKKCKQGNYLVFYFNAESGLIKELERNYRITDDIIKFITVRNDGKEG